jgi:hypothetical protein
MMRHYLARLKRKTHSYSKSLQNLADSILFIFARKLMCTLTTQTSPQYITCRALWIGDVSIPI